MILGRFISIAIVFFAISAGHYVHAEGGIARICLSSDFDWRGNQRITLPADLIFEGSGILCGDLYQPNKLKSGDPRLKCYQTKDIKNTDSAFILSESITLTASIPCNFGHIRTIVAQGWQQISIQASPSRAFLAYQILGLPSRSPGDRANFGIDQELALAIDNFDIRGVVTRDAHDAMNVKNIATGERVPPMGH